jgi:hypothetical protein
MAPRIAEPQSLTRLLIQFKLKISALKGTDTAKAARDCEAAAKALEECVAVLEVGLPAMHLASSQASKYSHPRLWRRFDGVLSFLNNLHARIYLRT